MRYTFGPYPMMANWLLVNKRNDETYSVKNFLTNETFQMDYDSYHFLRNLNGRRDPMKVAEKFNVDADTLMEFFKENWLVRESRKIQEKKGTFMYTLFIPEKKRTKSILPKIFSGILYAGWLPTFLYGLYRVFCTSYDFSGKYLVLGWLVGIIVGAVLHEMAHIMVSLATEEAYFYEAGIFFEKTHPGAYVMVDKSEVKSWAKRVAIAAGGVVADLFLTGIFLILGTTFERISGFCLGAVIINIFLVGFNFTMLEGMDGCLVIGDLIGLPKGVRDAKKILVKSIEARNSANRSCNKRVAIIACSILVVYQVLMPIITINCILLLLGGFW